MDALAGDVAVVQDECDLRIGDELRECVRFVGRRDSQRGDAEVSEMVQRTGSGGAGERIGVGRYGVVPIEDKETAGNRLRDGELGRDRLRLSSGNPCGGGGRECEQEEASKHGNGPWPRSRLGCASAQMGDVKIVLRDGTWFEGASKIVEAAGGAGVGGEEDGEQVGGADW